MFEVAKKLFYGSKGKRKSNREIMEEQKKGVQKHGNLSILKSMTGETGEEQGRRAFLQSQERERRSRNKKY